MSTRLIPQFAYAANPYLAAFNAQMYSQWGFPDLYYPASPMGFMGYSSDIATLYTTNLPQYVYYPSFFGSLNTTFVTDPRFGIPNVPYATTAEVIYNSQYGLTDALARESLTTAAAITTLAGTYMLGTRMGGPLLTVGRRIPIISGALSLTESGLGSIVGESGLATRLLRAGSRLPGIGRLFGLGAGALAGMSGSGALAGLLGLTIGWLGAEALIAGTLDYFVIQPTADVIRDTQRIRTSLGRLLIGSEDFLPVTGGITARASHELYRELLKTYREEITVDYSDIMAILTAGTQTGLFEQIGPNRDRIIQTVKTLSHYLRIVSEIARDPSLVDTIKNVAQLANAGISVEQAPMVYRQMAVQATAGGYALSNLWPIAQQFGQYYQQLGLAPATGMVMTPGAFLSGRMMNQFLYGMGLGATAASLGGAEGIAQMHLAAFGQNVAANPLFHYMLLTGQGVELGRFTFNEPVDLRRYLYIRTFTPEVAEQIREQYGDAFTVNVDYALKLKRDVLDKLGLSPEAQIMVMTQAGIPKDVAIMALQENQLVRFYAQRAYRERQAEIMDVLNETELRSEGLLTKFERAKRFINTEIRKTISGEIFEPIHEWVETARYRYRFGGTTPFERAIGYILFGTPPVETGAPLTLPIVTRIGEEEYSRILKDTRIEQFIGGIRSELEGLFVEDLTAEQGWEKLFKVNLETEARRVPALGILDAAVKRGEISFKGMTLEEALRSGERFLKGKVNWKLLSEFEKRQVSRMIATQWARENKVSEDQLPEVRERIFEKNSIANLELEAQKLKSDTERSMAKLEEEISSMVNVRYSELAPKTLTVIPGIGGPLSWYLGDKPLKVFGPEKPIVKFLRKEIESILTGGESRITEQILREIGVTEIEKDLTPQEQGLEYIREYLKSVAEGKPLTDEAVLGRALLIQLEIINENSRLSIDSAKQIYDQIFGKEGAYRKAFRYRNLEKTKELAERITESFPYAIFGKEPSGKTKESIESTVTKDVIVAYTNVLRIAEDGKITQQEISENKEDIRQIRSYLKSLASNLEGEEKQKVLSLLSYDDKELVSRLAQGGRNAILADVESHRASGVKNVIASLGDLSEQAKSAAFNLKKLNDELERSRSSGGFLNRLAR